jgi:hypothetical protein
MARKDACTPVKELNIPDCIGPLPQYFLDSSQSGIVDFKRSFKCLTAGFPAHYTVLKIYLRHRARPELRHVWTFLLN